MIRKIIKIDSEKCNACGLCVSACHEGAIAIKNNKAVLVQESYCDGLGNCLPVCPTDAISFETTEVPVSTPLPENRLRHWPIQLKLAPINAPYLEHAALLIAADCSAYSYNRFYEDFMKNKITLIGCPKLDSIDYSEKLTQLISGNALTSLTVVRMEVPCCGGIEWALTEALKKSGKTLPLQVVVLSVDGRILEVR